MSKITGKVNYKSVLKGDTGYTYKPHVTTDGILYWSNNGDLPNPLPVNIKGKDGNIVQEEEINSINNKLDNTILEPNIKKFGGHGDGINDDTKAINDFLEWYRVNKPNSLIKFPYGKYLISQTIIIPKECKFIDFNNSVFLYKGLENTYCISSGYAIEDDGYTQPIFKNINIECNQKLNNGLDITRLRNGIYENIKITNSKIALNMGDSWSSKIDIRIYRSEIGIKTGRSCNGVNITCDIEYCNVGIEMGKEELENTWGANGVFINNGSLIQNCEIAIQLFFIKCSNVSFTYFENNKINIHIPAIENKEQDIKLFSLKNCIFDCANNIDSMIYIEDMTRPYSMEIESCTIIGRFNKKLINLSDENNPTNLKKMVFNNNILTSNLKFNEIFPNNYRFNKVTTDIPYIPILSDGWDIIENVMIYLNNGINNLIGSIKRNKDIVNKNGNFIIDLPYYMLNETKKTNYAIPVIVNNEIKLSRLEVTSFKTINIYLNDITNKEPLTISNITWNVN